MKLRRNSLLSVSTSLVFSLTSSVFWQGASAATRIKDDNANDLNLSTSWVGAQIPGALDVATWDANVTGTNSAILGGNLSWGGIAIASPAGPVTVDGLNTLTLGTSGIDMSAATQDFTIKSNLALASGNQAWNVATGRTLFITSLTFSRATGATLLVDRSVNTGTISAAPTMVNGVLPWTLVRSAGTAANGTAAGFNLGSVIGGNIVAFTGATAVTTSYPANNATANYDWSSAGTQPQIGSSRAANTIRYTGTGVVQTTNSTQTETFNALINAGTGLVSLGGGTQVMNIQSATGELVLGAMTSGITINGPIINNGSTAGNVTIMGGSGQAVTLAATNTFSGSLTINSGTLQAGTGQGAAPATSNLGALQPASNRNIIINNGGTLSLTGGNVLGTGASTNTLSNNTLVVNPGGVFRTGLDGAGAGWWNKIGAINLNGGTIRVGSGANTTNFQALALIGTVIVDGLIPSAIEAFAASNPASNSLHLGQNAATGQAITFNVADVTANSASDLTVAPGLTNTSANLTASGLTKSGTGTLTLSGASTYTGSTTINAGTLEIGAGGTSGALAATAITNNANLVFNRSDASTFAGSISGAGNLTKSGAGALTLAGANTHSGSTLISAGSLVFSNAASTIGAVSVADAAVLEAKAAAADSAVLNSTSLTLGTAAGATLSFNFNNLNTTAPLISTGAVTTSGPLTVALSGFAGLSNGMHPLLDYSSVSGSGLPTGTYQFAPRVFGTLVNDEINTLLSVDVINDAIIAWSGVASDTWETAVTSDETGPHNWLRKAGQTATNFWANDIVEFNDTYNIGAGDVPVTRTLVVIPGVSPASTVVNNSAIDYTFDCFSNGISTGALTKSGSGKLTLLGDNTYTGTTTVNAGTLQLGDGSVSANLPATSGITNNAAVAFNPAGDLNFNRVISGTGSVSKTGTANLTIASAQTYTGTTAVQAGTLTLGATLAGPISISTDAVLSLNVGQPNFTNAVSGGGNINNAASTAIFGDHSGFSGTYTHNNTTVSTAINSGTATSENAAYVLASVQGSSQGFVVGANGDYTVKMGSLSGVTNSLLRGGNVATGTSIIEIGNLNTNTVMLGAINNGATKVLGLTKLGTGSFTIGGACNYTAATNVNGGTLVINGALGNTMVTVAAPATLSGGGTIAGAVSSAGTIAPGNGVGNLTTGEAAITGTLAIEVNGTLNDKLISTGALDLSTATLAILPVVDGFTEASYVIAEGTSITGSFATVPEGYTVTIVAGGPGQQAVLAPDSGYLTWSAANAGGQAAQLDFDQDGVQNGVEYFMNAAAGQTANPGVVAGAVTWPNGGNIPKEAYGTQFVVQVSDNLSSWTNVPVENVTNTDALISYTLPTGAASKFVRLSVTPE